MTPSSPPAVDALSLDRWQQIDTLFAAALERPADERTAFLRASCGQDPSLYHEVLALLASDTEAASVLGESATDFAAPLLPGLQEALGSETDLPAGARVGPYRIEGLLGRGGMGRVYLAERADGAFEKRVALKVVKRGMDTDEVLARFRRERQLLAGLDHPHIARLLDGGATEDGRPYLVMECVEGEPITAYADRHRLPLDARLALFEQIAEAVAYAHRNLVVHRDLKPSNILVTEDGQAKLLDFGIAKLLGDDDAAHTREGLRLLTPEYAAPEQVRGEAVTTATDVYALGVLLYELMTGRRPCDLAGPGLLARERALLHAEPPRPSAALVPEAAAARATTPERLRRRLNGDLDTIVLKALRREPERRYASVGALREDLRRAQRGLPVEARPESALYRAGKFVRRHRLGVAAATAFVLLLAGSVVALGLQQRQTARERDRAEAARARAEQTAGFLEGLFDAADPFAPERLDTLRARDLLARGQAAAERDLAEQPLLQAQLLGAIGRAYTRLGLYAEAEAVLRRALVREALAINRAALGDDHPHVADNLSLLGSVLRGQGRLDEAAEALREAIARTRGDRDPDVAVALNTYAGVLLAQEDFAGAEAVLDEAIGIVRDALGDDHPAVAFNVARRAQIYHARGDHAAAVEDQREALRIFEARFGAGSLHVALAQASLGGCLADLGRYAEAEAQLQASLAALREMHDDEHPRVQGVQRRLAALYEAQGQPVAQSAGLP